MFTRCPQTTVYIQHRFGALIPQCSISNVVLCFEYLVVIIACNIQMHVHFYQLQYI